MSIWYAMAEPALYCTAITAAVALEIWSIFFYIKAVYWEKNENKQILFAAIGALLGALVFGCRPPVALANIVVIPLLFVFLKEHPFSKKLAGKLALAATPYLLVAMGLMTYNYVRFDNPFEFGQAYQLTVTDQSNYSLAINGSQLLRMVNETINHFSLSETLRKPSRIFKRAVCFSISPSCFSLLLFSFRRLVNAQRKRRLFRFCLGWPSPFL